MRASFFIRTEQGGKLKVEGKIIELESGEKVGVYKTGVRERLFNKPYKPCWSITCLKTGYSFFTVKKLKDFKDRRAIKYLLGRRVDDYKYLLNKFKGDYCNT